MRSPIAARTNRAFTSSPGLHSATAGYRSSTLQAGNSRFSMQTAAPRSCSTARSTTSCNCGRSWRRSATGSRQTQTPRSSCTPGRHGAANAYSVCAACSHSPSGTRSGVTCSWRVIVSASSLCTTPCYPTDTSCSVRNSRPCCHTRHCRASATRWRSRTTSPTAISRNPGPYSRACANFRPAIPC